MGARRRKRPRSERNCEASEPRPLLWGLTADQVHEPQEGGRPQHLEPQARWVEDGLCCSPRGKDARGGSQGRRTAGPSAAASLNPRLSLKSRVSAQDSRGMEGGPQRSTLENQSEASGAGGTQATRPVSSSQDTHPVAAGAGLGAWPDSQPLPPRPRGRCPQRGTVTQTEGDEPAIPPGTTSLPTPTQNPTSTPAPGSWGRGRTGVLGEGQKGEPHFLSPPCLCSARFTHPSLPPTPAQTLGSRHKSFPLGLPRAARPPQSNSPQ